MWALARPNHAHLPDGRFEAWLFARSIAGEQRGPEHLGQGELVLESKQAGSSREESTCLTYRLHLRNKPTGCTQCNPAV